MLAVTGIPAADGDFLAAPIVLQANNADTTNSLTITLDDTNSLNPGVVVATISDGTVTRNVWNFTDITFTGTFDTPGDIVNTVNITSRYGFDLTSDPSSTSNFYAWRSVADFTPGTLTDVRIDLENVDVLTLSAPLGGTSIEGRFEVPTMIPAAPRGQIEVASNEGIQVGAGGVEAYDLTLKNNHAGKASAISLLGGITTKNDLTIRDSNLITIDRPLVAGGDLSVTTVSSPGGSGGIVVDASLTAQAGGVEITAVEDIAVNAPVVSVLGSIDLDADDALVVNAQLEAQGGISLVGNTKVTLTPAAVVRADTGSIVLTSAAGSISTDGSIETLDAGDVTFDASTGIASDAKVTSAAGDVVFTGGNGGITATGALEASAGSVSLTARLGVETAVVEALESISIKAGTNVTLNDLVTVTGAPAGTGLVEVIADAGDLVQAPTAKISVVDGTVNLQSISGAVLLNAAVEANLEIDVSGEQGVTIDNAVAPTAGLLSATRDVTVTSDAGSVTVTGSLEATAGGITIDAKLAASIAKATAFESITVDGGTDVTVTDAVSVTGAPQGTGVVKLTADAGDLLQTVKAPITVVDGKIELRSVSGTVTLNSLVQSNLDIEIDADQGIRIDNAVDLAAAVVMTGTAGTGSAITLKNTANQIVIDAPITAQAGSIEILNVNDDIELRDDVFALGDLSVTGKTNVKAVSMPDFVTLTTQTGTLTLESTAAGVEIAADVTIVAGPGESASVALLAATTVKAPVVLTAEGDLTVVSPDGYTVTKSMLTKLGSISIATSAGPLTSILAPLTAGQNITLEAAGPLTIDNQLEAELGGINLKSTGASVSIAGTAILVAPDAAAGTLTIDAGTSLALGIPVLVGNDITIAVSNTFTPGFDLTSTNGSLDVTVTAGDLDVSGIAISTTGGTAPDYGSVLLSALAGTLTIDRTKIDVNPTFGDLTLIAGTLVGFGGASYTLGGSLTVQAGNGVVPGAGEDLESVNGNITIRSTAGNVDVSAIDVKANNGSIALESDTNDVIVGTKAFTVSPTIHGLPAPPWVANPGEITLRAGGAVVVGQSLSAGSDITIDAAATFNLNHDIVSDFGNVAVTSSAGDLIIDSATASLIAADVTSGAIVLVADGKIDAATPGDPILTKLIAADMTAAASGASGFRFTNPENDVETLDLTLPNGTDVFFTDIDTLQFSGTITITSGDVEVTTLSGPLTVSAVIDIASGDVRFDSAAGSLEVTGDISIATAGTTGVTLTAATNLAMAGVTVGTGDVVATATAGNLTAAGDITVATGDVELTSTAGSLDVTGAISVATGTTGVALVAGTTLTFGDVTIGDGSIAATAAGLVSGTGTIAVTKGDLELTSTASGVSVVGSISVDTAVTTGVTLTAATDLDLAGVTIGTGDLVATATAGNLTAAGDITVATGDVLFTVPAGDIVVTGAITATKSDIDLTAGAGIQIGGDIKAGGGVSLTAGATSSVLTNGIELTGAEILAGTADINILQVGSVVDDGVLIHGDMTAGLGSIYVKTDANIDFTGGTITAAPVYVAGPPTVGLVRLEGALSIAMPNGQAHIIAGRLEVLSVNGGGTDLALSGAVSTLMVIAPDSDLTFVNEIPLTLTDFNNFTPSIQINAFNVTITSPMGIDVIDGIEHAGTLSLAADGVIPVEFFPVSTGDNFGGSFAGTLRDHLQYVNANLAADQPMSILASLEGTPLALVGTVTLDESLPGIRNTVLIDGRLPDAAEGVSVGGVMGIDGSMIAPAVGAHGLTLAAGSSGSHIRNAAIYGFDSGTGIRVESSNNLMEALLIGQNRLGATNNLTANNVGIDLSGAAAARNVIGVRTVGVDAGNVIVNSNEAGILVRAGADFASIFGNFVGTDRTGAALGNRGDGIVIEDTIGTLIGGVDTVFGNAVSNSGRNGILVQDVSASLLPYGARIIGNTIDDNAQAGVRVLGGRNNVIGGAQLGAGNRFSGNEDGIVLGSSLTTVTHSNLIEGNFVADNTVDGLRVEYGWNNTVNGNEFDGNGAAGVRLLRTEAVKSATSSRPSNIVTRNLVTGNGNTNLTGGIVLESASGQVIGGDPINGVGNEVFGNGGSGIVVLGGQGNETSRLNTIRGNFLGTTADATVVDSNGGDGIRVQGAITNTITENTVAASNGSGIAIENALASSLLRGNVVTLNSVSGSEVGIRVTGGSRHQIGTSVATEGNTVFGNRSDGIVVERSSGTGPAVGVVVRNNRIGLDTSNAADGNGGHGIRITDSTGTAVDYSNLVSHNAAGGILVQGGSDTTIGSTQTSRYENRFYRTVNLGTPFRANTVTLNGGDGITIANSANPLTPAAITTRINVVGNVVDQNVGEGIVVDGDRVSGVTIGRRPSVGRPDRNGNQVRHNQAGGITVDGAQSITLIGNEIIGNGAAGSPQIQLLNAANGGAGSPTITSAAIRSSGQRSPQYDVRGTISGTPRQRFYVDFYGNRGADSRQLYLGRVLVTIRSDGTGTFRYLATADREMTGGVDTITATATLATTLLGGTSAFSAPVIPT